MDNYFSLIAFFVVVVAVLPALSSAASEVSQTNQVESVSLSVQGQFQSYFLINGSDNELVTEDISVEFGPMLNLSNDRLVFGNLSFNFSDSDDMSSNTTDTDFGSSKVEEAYVGFDFGQYMLGYGKTYYPSDIFNISTSVRFGASTAFESRAIYGSEVLFGRIGNRYVEALLALDYNPIATIEDYDYSQDALVLYDTSVFQVGLAFQRVKQSKSGDHVATGGISVIYETELLIMGVAYSKNSDISVQQYVFSYFLSNRWRISLGADFADDDQKHPHYWYTNTAYTFHKNVQFFGELGDSDSESNTGDWLLGMEISF